MPEEPQKEDGLALEYLEKLTLYDSSFEYRGVRYDYDDIEHIEFTAVATKHSINFIPAGTSYNSELFLHIKGRSKLHIKQERVFLKRNTKDRSEAVMRAAAIFMDVTFNHRIETYESEMTSKGFVSWGKYQIARNGDLFRNNELRFNILSDDISCNLGPFHVECIKRNLGLGDRLKELWTSAGEIIDISIDRDCFLYIMKNFLGLSWRREKVPEKRKTGKQIFNEALLTLGAMLCKVDGRVSPEEIVVFKRYFGIDEKTHPGAGRVFAEATKLSAHPRRVTRDVHSLLSGNKEPLEYILIGLMQIAAADGKIDPAERKFIDGVGNDFGFSETEIRRLFLLYEQTDERTRRRKGSNGSRDRSEMSLHLEVLGLRTGATFDEIKGAYRDLARKHHPDLLRAQGVPIDDIQNAEEILKAINSAYEWLARHHERGNKHKA